MCLGSRPESKIWKQLVLMLKEKKTFIHLHQFSTEHGILQHNVFHNRATLYVLISYRDCNSPLKDPKYGSLLETPHFKCPNKKSRTSPNDRYMMTAYPCFLNWTKLPQMLHDSMRIGNPGWADSVRQCMNGLMWLALYSTLSGHGD